MTTTPTTSTSPPGREPVAIIGMGCRLPGSITTPDQMWKTLVEGRDCITHIPQDRWENMVQHLHPDQVPDEPYAAGVVDHSFDHTAFGVTADEAAQMDPQQGRLLEVGHEALADASLTPASVAGSRTGVYVGAASIDQATVNFAPGSRAGGVHLLRGRNGDPGQPALPPPGPGRALTECGHRLLLLADHAALRTA